MTNRSIPLQVDPRKFADRALAFSGEYPLLSFTRVSELLVDAAGDVKVELSFARDDQGLAVTRLQFETEVRMICQRCLDEVVLPLSDESYFVAVVPGADTSLLPQEYDVLELDEKDKTLDVLALIEEELLLALPIIPMHPEGRCEHPDGYIQSDLGEDETARTNPFSVLAQLKRDSNV